MESVGTILRSARLHLGLMPEDVSSQTRINLKNLLAIEADELDTISSRFLYKSFVRQIGQAVKIDSGLLEQSLTVAADAIPEPLVPGQPGAPRPPKLASLRPQQVNFGRWAYSLGLLALVLVACSSLYAMWQNARGAGLQAWLHQVHPSTQTARNRQSVAPIAAPRVSVAAIPKPQPTPPEVSGDFRIQLSAIEQTWLSVVADGHEVYSGILKAAETRTLEGHDTARIRTGNAGGIEVVFNGRNLGALGSRGQVRTVIFNRDGYEVLQPRASVALTLVSSHSRIFRVQPVERW